MAWVERGHAPNELIASHSANIGHDGPPAGVPPGGRPPMGPPPGMTGDGPPLGPGGLPPNMAGGPPQDMPHPGAGTADRMRTAFPYPLTAKYIVTRSIDEANNFVAGNPQPAP